MKARVDKNVCIGCQMCVQICPDVFQMNDEGIAVVLVDTINVKYENLCKEAQEMCPVMAIALFSDGEA
ncbi:MAG: ferredoxin [Chitinivibrionales bacterium]|nr:ferredoxin [Chitinivibrionales bacterium]